MKIGIIGFGKTGKAVATTIIQHSDFTLEWVVKKNPKLDKRSVTEFLGLDSPHNDNALIFSLAHTTIENLLSQHPVDCIIDFSSNEAIYSYGKIAAEHNITIISAISHYYEPEIELLKQISLKTKTFWSPNITLGVNYLLVASKFLKKIAPHADIEIVEEHFRDKTGVSGTALKLAEVLDINKKEINSVRAGGIVGKHQIIFGFPFQTVRLIHESISREAFGNGVIFVAQNLADKKVGFYTFEDLLLPYFNQTTIQ